jgi:chemotaxis protein MotB
MVGACRSNTDRIRVLEAQKADADRMSQQARQEQAELRAKLLEEQGRADSNEARTKALEAQLDMLKNRQAGPGAGGGETGIDTAKLRNDLEGSGISVAERQDGGASIILASDITFHAGRADLNGTAQTALSRVATALKRERTNISEVRIEGHTDSDPIRKSGWKDNEELSLARAGSVRKFLVAQGIEEDLLSVEGYGAVKPVASNTTNDGKARNRRVEIVLVAREG